MPAKTVIDKAAGEPKNGPKNAKSARHSSGRIRALSLEFCRPPSCYTVRPATPCVPQQAYSQTARRIRRCAAQPSTRTETRPILLQYPRAVGLQFGRAAPRDCHSRTSCLATAVPASKSSVVREQKLLQIASHTGQDKREHRSRPADGYRFVELSACDSNVFAMIRLPGRCVLMQCSVEDIEPFFEIKG